jgi:hypothetical protein
MLAQDCEASNRISPALFGHRGDTFEHRAELNLDRQGDA